MLSRFFLLLSVTLLSQAIKQEPRAFSLFSIVTFKNGPCSTQTTAGIEGVCMTADECTSAGGSADGNCASGFGSCCLIRISTCGATASKNCTYIENVGYPTASTSVTSCSFTVQECQDDICQIRLDFVDAVIAQPNDAGTCTNAILTTTAGTTAASVSANPPILCGTLTGQHIYIDSGRATTAATLAFTFAAASTASNRFRIKVSQIGCGNLNRAPEGCLQYFYGKTTHTVTSFNWDGTDLKASGGLLASQMYVSCTRREENMCGLTYTTTPVTTGLDAFEMDLTADTIGEVGTDCTTSWVSIPAAVTNTYAPTGPVVLVPEDNICGGVFSNFDAAEVGNNGQTVLANPVTGWDMGVVSAASTTTGVSGFSLDVTQLPCGSF